ncbi:hypothetical protein JKF63_06074 [Porcisia hertigi]|uniref:Uncharacterized protein n=1 Tax=Porcisia hertigi TaxID=2761500 RepID=A0A836IWM7_9TRYP|nr:hypothetical protein JKF63_06074 [Porcisia hertigi]
MNTRRGTKAAARRPIEPSLRALDEHVERLRAEARTGLSSKDVRRALIKEGLRRPTPPLSAYSSICARDRREPSHTMDSVSCGSLATSTGAGGNIAGIPSAWLEGDFHLEPAGDGEDGGAGAPSSRSMRPAGGEAVASFNRTADSPPVSSEVLRMYQALCTAAEEVDYDFSHEEALRQVETRDAETGLATTWRTRRYPSAPWPCSSTAAMTASVDNGERRGLRLVFGGCVEAARDRSMAASHELYTAPPSRLSTAHASAPSRLSTPLTLSLPASQASIMPASALPTTVSTGRVNGSVLRSHGGRAGASSSLSTEGTVVVRSSAATYAKALRQLVQTHRQQVNIVGGAPSQSNSTSAAWPPSGDDDPDGGNGGAAALEWRTHMRAPVTLAVCSSCHMWFERSLQQPQHLPSSSRGGQQAAEGMDKGSRCCCPRCGCDVDSAAGTDMATAAAAAAGPRWAWEPTAATDGSRETSREPCGTPARIIDPPRARSPRQKTFPAQAAASHRSIAVASGATCGTDSVGFTEADEEESFAALVARIRASRMNAQGNEEKGARVSPSAAESVSTRAPADMNRSRGCTETGTLGKPNTSPPAALTAPPAWTKPTGPVHGNPFALSLRVALSHPYFHDLWASAMGERP